jgi:hypothetical protein
MSLVPAHAVPDEIIVIILDHLSGINLLNAALVCKSWGNVARSICNLRNERVRRVIVDEVLAKFSPTCWAVAGSASLWLWLWVNGRNPFWTPGDVDVWYTGAPGSDVLRHFFENSQFPDSDTQPPDVEPFQLQHGPSEEDDGYRSGSVIERRGMKIHTCCSPGTVRRLPAGTVQCRFDLHFLQIAVNMYPAGRLVFYFSRERTPVEAVWSDHQRADKYAERIGRGVMADMGIMMETMPGIVIIMQQSDTNSRLYIQQ